MTPEPAAGSTSAPACGGSDTVPVFDTSTPAPVSNSSSARPPTSTLAGWSPKFTTTSSEPRRIRNTRLSSSTSHETDPKEGSVSSGRERRRAASCR